MRRDGFEQELTFREAAEKLNRRNDSRGRSLRAMVLAREKQTKKQIAIRLNGEKEPKLRITIGALYRAFPELMPARVDDIARLVGPMLQRHQSKVRELVQEEIKASVDPRLKRLERNDRIVRDALRRMAKPL